MSRGSLFGAFIVLFFSAPPAFAYQDLPEVTTPRVDAALKQGAAYLWSLRQKQGGRWEQDPARGGVGHEWETGQGDSYGGFTALAVYALLEAGEKRTDPRVAESIEFLKNVDMIGAYAIALRLQVWHSLPPTEEIRTLAQKDVRKLEALIVHSGPASGLWTYGGAAEAGKPVMKIDHSVSQYGVLGLWAGARMGAGVREADWKLFDSAWRNHQNPDGGWSYNGARGEKDSTASMTAAGLATLFITQEQIRTQPNRPCNGNVVDRAIESALTWMGDHFEDSLGSNYALFGVERVAAASGYRFFGKTDWYARGAQQLLQSQLKDGSWLTGAVGSTPMTDTAFAMLFLSRGRAPVVMNKLDYTVPGDEANHEVPWNERPRDAANLTRYIGESLERYLRWQIVNLSAPVDELLIAPVLYISGNKIVGTTDDDQAKLREYVLRGGMIVCNADCPTEPSANDAFVQSMTRLGEKLFQRKFRRLPASHPIFTSQQFRAANWRELPAVLGLSNGVREFMIILPDSDPARAWQNDDVKSNEPKFQLGADLFLYAVGRQNLQYTGMSPIVKPIGEITREVKLARLMIGENPDPEPAGWDRLSSILRSDFGVGLMVEPVRLGEGKLRPAAASLPASRPAAGAAPQAATQIASTKPAEGFPAIAHLTGTTGFELNPAQRKEIGDFVAGGGTLIIDAAAASPAFAASAEKMLATLYPEAVARTATPASTLPATTRPATSQPHIEIGTVLPLGHALFNVSGAPIQSVEYRMFARGRVVGKLNVPRLRAIPVGGRLAVFYSAEDLSAGLVGQPVDGIIGYEPESATALMRNLILFAAR